MTDDQHTDPYDIWKTPDFSYRSYFTLQNNLQLNILPEMAI